MRPPIHSIFEPLNQDLSSSTQNEVANNHLPLVGVLLREEETTSGIRIEVLLISNTNLSTWANTTVGCQKMVEGHFADFFWAPTESQKTGS